MGIETYPVLEGSEEGAFFLTAEWKWLTDCMGSEHLDGAAERSGVARLGRFVSYSRQDAIQSLGEEEVGETEQGAELRNGRYYRDDEELWSPEREWFQPEDALKTTGALLQYLRSNPEALIDEGHDAEAYIEVLEALKGVLTEAQHEHRRFYLKACL